MSFIYPLLKRQEKAYTFVRFLWSWLNNVCSGQGYEKLSPTASLSAVRSYVLFPIFIKFCKYTIKLREPPVHKGKVEEKNPDILSTINTHTIQISAWIALVIPETVQTQSRDSPETVKESQES